MIRHLPYSTQFIGVIGCESFSKKLDECRKMLRSTDVSSYRSWYKTDSLRKNVQSIFINYIDVFVAYYGDPTGIFEIGYAVEVYCMPKFDTRIIKVAFCSTPQEAISFVDQLCKKIWLLDNDYKREVENFLRSLT